MSSLRFGLDQGSVLKRPGLTTPCHRIRPSEEPVLISSSMVSGESWALKQKKKLHQFYPRRAICESGTAWKSKLQLPSWENGFRKGNVAIIVEMSCILIR